MNKVELCDNGRCKRVRMGEEQHVKDTFSNKFTRQEKRYWIRIWLYSILGFVLGIYFAYAPEIIIPNENRWDAVIGSMAVVATLIVGDTHRHYQNKQNQTTSLFKIFELLSSPDIRYSRRIVHEEYCRIKKTGNPIIFKKTKEIPDLESHVDNVLSAFDQVSATVLNGLIDEELFFDTYGEMIVRDWKTMEAEITSRQSPNSKTLRHFTILKNKFEKRVKPEDVKPYCKD